jgi:hypothetical protein
MEYSLLIYRENKTYVELQLLPVVYDLRPETISEVGDYGSPSTFV